MGNLFLLSIFAALLFSSANGQGGASPVDVLPCSNTVWQNWKFVGDQILGNDGRCLDVGDCSVVPGDTEVGLFPCNSTLCDARNQHWTYNSDKSIVTQLDGLCLDLNVNDGKLQTWNCSGANNQKWAVDGAHLVNVATGGCLTAAIGVVYSNPVLNRDFPDPTVIRGGDGNFYAYSTQSSGCNICVAQSSDLVNWGNVQNALPTPSWASGNFWAPDVSLHNGIYYMYYAGQQNGGNLMCLNVATSSNPQGPFNDARSTPLICSSSSNAFSAIDPKMFDAPNGNIYLYWGSDFVPINVQQLDASRLNFAPGSSPIPIIYPSSAPYETLIEGTWVQFKPRQSNYYFAFYSGDNCCGTNAHYAVMVARSLSPTGPFEKLGHPILVAGGRWDAPGHNSVITDDAGEDWIFYHSIDLNTGDYNTRKLMCDQLQYIDDWPVIANSPGIPTNSPQYGPLA